MSEPPILSAEEIQLLTGYRQPARQLSTLLAMGYWRARRSQAGDVILERPHFQAVSQGPTKGEAENGPKWSKSA